MAPRVLALVVSGMMLLALGCQPAGRGADPPAARGAAPAAPAAAATSRPLQKVTVAFVAPSETMAIPWIAQETGIFARHGFDADIPLVTGSPRLAQSLIAGDFDYALVGATALIRARIQGADPVILAATTNYSTQKLLVHPAAGIPRLADVRGRTIGVSQYGSEADTFLRIVLAKTGIAAEDVQILQTGGHPQTLAAMLSGNLEAGVLGSAIALAAEQAGMIRLADPRQLDVLSPTGTLAATRRTIERDRESVVRFLRAYVEGVHFFKTQRDETIRILQKNLVDLPESEVALVWEAARDEYQPLPAPSEEAIQAVLERETDPAAKSFQPADFIDLSLLREVDESGFIRALYQ
jgi:ABC-type nitrate/sulfonate/bicarbonate transport system substrate-binding protein